MTFVLDCDFKAALALDKKALKVTTNEGTDLAEFGGYEVLGVEKDGDGYTVARFGRVLEANTEAAIQSLQSTVNANVAGLADNVEKTATAQETADTAQGTVTEMGELMEIISAALEEISATVFSE